MRPPQPVVWLTQLAGTLLFAVIGACADEPAPDRPEVDAGAQSDSESDQSDALADVAPDADSGSDVRDSGGDDGGQVDGDATADAEADVTSDVVVDDADADSDVDPDPRHSALGLVVAGGRGTSPGYRLFLRVGAPQPMGESANDAFQLRLGLAAP